MGRTIKKTPCVMERFTLLDNIEKCHKCSVMKVFNNTVRAFRGMLRSGTYALDSTIIETKPEFPGCGITKRKKEGRPTDPPDYDYIIAKRKLPINLMEIVCEHGEDGKV